MADAVSPSPVRTSETGVTVLKTGDDLSEGQGPVLRRRDRLGYQFGVGIRRSDPFGVRWPLLPPGWLSLFVSRGYVPLVSFTDPEIKLHGNCRVIF